MNKPDPKDTRIAELSLDLAVANAQLAKSDELYLKLAEKHDALVRAHQALIERAYPTQLSNE